MKRRIFIFSVTLVLLFAMSFSYAQEGYQVKHVVIDAGHGGKDPGAVGKTSKEKDIALAISLKVGNYIKENFKDVKVSYTREKDVFIELYKRAKIARDAKADLFISVHVNASEKSSPKGTETIVMGMHRSEKNLRLAQKENASILLETDYDKTYGNFDPYAPESYIKFKLLQNEFRAQSIIFAQNVQEQFRDRVKLVDRGVKEAGLLVLVNTTMPSVLIEVGFISNPSEEKFLKSERGQDLLSSAIYRAFKKYKKTMEAANAQNVSELPDPTPVMADGDTMKETTQSIPVDTPTPPQPSSTDVIVGVQFTISSRKKSVNSFGELADVWYYEQNGMFKYVSGKYTNIEKANDHLKRVKSEGYKDAFLVYFQNGERIKRSEALKALK